MRAVKPISIYPPLSPEPESAINQLERALKIRLPEDYKCFLKTTGGGAVDHGNCWIDPAKHSHIPHSVDVFCLLTVSEIQRAIKVYSGRIPEGMLPVGDNLGGDLLLIECFKSKGGVYYWDHEQEDLAFEIIEQIPPPDRVQCFKVADSFSQFADMLEKLPDDS